MADYYHGCGWCCYGGEQKQHYKREDREYKHKERPSDDIGATRAAINVVPGLSILNAKRQYDHKQKARYKSKEHNRVPHGRNLFIVAKDYYRGVRSYPICRHRMHMTL